MEKVIIKQEGSSGNRSKYERGPVPTPDGNGGWTWSKDLPEIEIVATDEQKTAVARAMVFTTFVGLVPIIIGILLITKTKVKWLGYIFLAIGIPVFLFRGYATINLIRSNRKKTL